MGRDKALLPHPSGDTWLERSLALLAELGAPVTLMSRHRSHGALAQAWADRGSGGVRSGSAAQPVEPALEIVQEPEPWQGPLLALARLMQRYPSERLLLCPVDMPWLDIATLADLRAAASADPARIHTAHDGSRLQPLLGLYPADGRHRRSLAAFTAAGGRSLQRWLVAVDHTAVGLPAGPLRNANHPADLADLMGSAGLEVAPANGGPADQPLPDRQRLDRQRPRPTA
ncbi:molybdenum cofactor guanylyltransferase [Vulcanococcus limneticus Candia 3F8]|uniref:molybdenum cofactor guanylyltransferase n=1 Tax=Vulcanococcus limneticus TaxID=2170428 RepID=UPI000B99D009|nr:molybdenum cofactor guanylyltransferase [Vulcanococcus limneticus MW73D5]MCP9893538.1 molybdenum cofactor guanylyltransferase [Vulcanococcus limneticus Candia 3F8]MCP9896614.1 molybdenum cofactor guanylyltransferase [Vulcanococcus limneticus Candia 3B3]